MTNHPVRRVAHGAPQLGGGCHSVRVNIDAGYARRPGLVCTEREETAPRADVEKRLADEINAQQVAERVRGNLFPLLVEMVRDITLPVASEPERVSRRRDVRAGRRD